MREGRDSGRSSGGQGLVFKGSGFYMITGRTEKGREDARIGEAAAAASKSDTKTESKTERKTETKPKRTRRREQPAAKKAPA